MYRLFFRVVLRRLPAETAHRAGFALIQAAETAGATGLLRRWLGPRDPVLRVRALGLDFPGPLGVAAGFDKDARATAGLGALGFGFVEVGTVTAQAQPGNPRPRMFRLPADRALVNRMGFNNDGAAAAAARLRRRRRGGPVVGVNIGKTRAAPEAEAAADYAASARAVAGVADYVVVNVSSPNTPGLRDLQAADRLRPVLVAVRSALDAGAGGGRRVPLLVKIAPDLAPGDIDAVADLAVELGLDGIIATNTTVARDGLASPPAEVAAAGAGGLSGPPLRPRALAVLRRLRERAGDGLVLIAAGGIETPDDAWERLAAGATLVQAYTGFIYGGPLWPRRIHAGLARRAREAGLSSVSGGEPGRVIDGRALAGRARRQGLDGRALADVARGQDRDGDLGVLGDVGADRALQQAREPAAAARADYDQLGVGALVEDFLGRGALGRLDRHRCGAGAAEPGQHLVGFGLGGLAGLVDQRFVARVMQSAAPEARHGLLDGEHGERGMAERRFFRGPFQGELRMGGTVYADEDSRHLTAPCCFNWLLLL